MGKRVFLIVLDSAGVGYEPDADRFGDVGSDEQEAVCPAVDEERTGIDSRLELEVLRQRVVVVPPDDDGEGDAGGFPFPFIFESFQ